MLAIWNAQSKLLARTTDDRTIKIGLGDTSTADGKTELLQPRLAPAGTVADPYKGHCSFTTSLNTTLQPFWNYASYCSNYTSRWCAATANCNYCTTLRSGYTVLTGAAQQMPTVIIANGAKTISCTDSTTTGGCYFDYSPCGGVTAGKCDGDANRSCTVAADCIDDYRNCITTDTCTTSGFTCNADCNSADCATAVIKYIRGYDNPYGSTTSGPGGTYRIRHKCQLDTNDLIVQTALQGIHVQETNARGTVHPTLIVLQG